MIIKFKTKKQMLDFFKKYEIRDEELLEITLLLDEDKIFQEANI